MKNRVTIHMYKLQVLIIDNIVELYYKTITFAFKSEL